MISSYIIILILTDVEEDEAVAPHTLVVSMFTFGNYIL
jgi:hypothetical protein